MNSLVILLGPTGVGKTELSLQVAERFGSPIISSDSRQLYKDLPIGTAAPTPEQMARVKHYMVGTLSLTDYYSASNFEEDVVSLLSELCDRINQRVDQMMSEGLLEEARRAYPFRHLNSLNTVGYKELFNYFSGEWTLDLAVEKIKRNSRVYARKQMTWFKRDPEITWFHPDETEAIFTHLSQQII